MTPRGVVLSSTNHDTRIKIGASRPGRHTPSINGTSWVLDVDRDNRGSPSSLPTCTTQICQVQVASDTESSAPDLQAAMRYLGVSGRRAQDVCSQVFLSVVCAPL